MQKLGICVPSRKVQHGFLDLEVQILDLEAPILIWKSRSWIRRSRSWIWRSRSWLDLEGQILDLDVQVLDLEVHILDIMILNEKQLRVGMDFAGGFDVCQWNKFRLARFVSGEHLGRLARPPAY